jgi:dolichyl-diphosphooligosaccharide--protein glycosyltransferase
MSLNDVCCYVPVWFGVSATCFLGLITAECSGSYSAGVVSALIMSIIPAHISRSVGGGYDNESVAMTAMCMTFYFWVRALRDDPKVKDGRVTRDSLVYGVLTGLAYTYMVAAWGGFIFVLNLIAVHAFVLCAIGRYSSKLHRAYSLFFVIGTLGAMRVPIVGLSPLKSMEQLSALAAFIGLQVLEYAARQRRSRGLTTVQVRRRRVLLSTYTDG